MTIREEMRTLKRDRILEAATQLFYENGYHGTSLDSIAESLGVTKPFIYYHFEKKADILQALYTASVQVALDTIVEARRSDGGPAERLGLFATIYTQVVIREHRRVAITSREKGLLPPEAMTEVDNTKRAFIRELAGLIQEGVAAGEFKAGDVSLTALSITGMINWINTWYRPDGSKTADQIAAHMRRMCLQMVGA